MYLNLFNKLGGGVSMYIDSNINYQSSNDINIEIYFVGVITIEISKEELNINLNIILINFVSASKYTHQTIYS